MLQNYSNDLNLLLIIKLNWNHTKYLNKSKAQPTLYIYGPLASFLKSQKNVTVLIQNSRQKDKVIKIWGTRKSTFVSVMAELFCCTCALIETAQVPPSPTCACNYT